MIYDLHSHSTFSDGVLSPIQLVERAHKNGVGTLALTDHDGIEGITEAQNAAHSRLSLIPGVEISARYYENIIHIVGLQIDPNNAALQAALTEIQKNRETRAHKIAQRLEKLQVKDAWQGARQYASSPRFICRLHFARYLVDIGRVTSVKSAFNQFLADRKPAYAALETIDLATAIALIRGANGIAVLAHPERYKLSKKQLQWLFHNFKAAGGQGTEIPLNLHHVSRPTIISLCKTHQLYASRGSDFHSPAGFLDLGQGVALPKDLPPVWQLWSTAAKNDG